MLLAMLALALPAFNVESIAAGLVGHRGSRLQISLKFAFCSHGHFSVLRGAMWNGWKKAAVGLSALLTFIALEIVAVAAGVAAFLSLVMDVDLPLLATSED